MQRCGRLLKSCHTAAVTPKAWCHSPGRRHIATASASSGDHLGLPDAAYHNVSPVVLEKVGRNLYDVPNHPLQILKSKVVEHFDKTFVEPATGKPRFKVFDKLHPKVSVQHNFDALLFPADHVSRRPSDTYFFDRNTVLRTHTTAHQTPLLLQKERAFLIVGDVYRRDEIDAKHYPIFHQLDGVRIFSIAEYEQNRLSADETYQQYVIRDLKSTLEGLVRHLVGNVEIRWVDGYFPFTHPSFELEVNFQDKWMELLGCGVIHKQIMHNVGLRDEEGWAFGIGFDRLAMTLFDIPDIRLMWSNDKRFLDQFSGGKIVKFKSYSKFPPCPKDISFWIPPSFQENDFFELVREIAGDLVESVVLVDEFAHPSTQRKSKCYRITYRHMDRNLTNEEIDKVQEIVRTKVPAALGVQLR